MDPITQQTLLASAGGKQDPVYVDDVFSTYLYNSYSTANRTINNGLDLDGKGGMVWLKKRNGSGDNLLYDTERYAVSQNTRLRSNTSGGEATGYGNDFGGFNSNGFDVKFNMNANNGTYASWSFRKQKGFFDVVTYTGNGVAGRTVAHNLGSVPGMIMIKRTNASENWIVGHRSITLGSGRLMLDDNTGNSHNNASQYWNSTAATSSQFTVGSHVAVNGNGSTYVAYIFAHDEPVFGTDEDESIIKCGQFEGYDLNEVNVGFEPQWLMVKSIDSGGGNWEMYDCMRGMSGYEDHFSNVLRPNATTAEYVDKGIRATATGFQVGTNSSLKNDTYIYVAIRRSHKPPEVGTDVLNISLSAINTEYTTGFVPDISWTKSRSNGSYDWYCGTRLLAVPGYSGTSYSFAMNSTGAGQNNGSYPWDITTNKFYTSEVADNPITYTFKRTPGFFDVITYKGASSYPITRYHSLGVAPEMIWLKLLDHTTNPWTIYHSLYGSDSYLRINDTSAVYTDHQLSQWYLTTPTDSYFKVGTHGGYTNLNGKLHIAYLWATLPGISKVGSYTGTGSTQTINCGFTTGARFVMIKRSDSSSHWFVFDTARGITQSASPWIALNQTFADQTGSGNNFIDPHSSGFTVDTTLSAINASGGTYIFLAIA